MPSVAFAFIGFDTDRIVQFAMNLLAVGGGFLAGHVLTGVIAWALDRWITGGKTPQGIHRVARTVGGVAVALLVALLLFGRGGTGPGDGGGGTSPSDKGVGNGASTQPTTSKEPQPPIVPQKEAPPPEQRVRVTMLGGLDVKDEKFYRIDDDPQPRTFTDVVAAVNAKKTETKKPVGIELRFTADNTLAENHPAVLRVISWAKANDVAITLPATKP